MFIEESDLLHFVSSDPKLHYKMQYLIKQCTTCYYFDSSLYRNRVTTGPRFKPQKRKILILLISHDRNGIPRMI